MNLWRNILIVLVLAGFVASCGVNGRPELPPGADPNQDQKSVLDELI